MEVIGCGYPPPDMQAQLLGPTPDTRQRLVVEACAPRLADVRRQVRAAVLATAVPTERGTDDPDLAQVSADLELVVSELATNVMLHTDQSWIEVGIERTVDSWVIEVDGAEGLVGPIEDQAHPGAELVPGGRGLLIVGALTDSVDVVERDGTHVIRCVRHL